MIPGVVTIDEAAAPAASLNCMYWGAVIVFSLVLLYTLVSYSVFSGKLTAAVNHY